MKRLRKNANANSLKRSLKSLAITGWRDCTLNLLVSVTRSCAVVGGIDFRYSRTMEPLRLIQLPVL